jgi:cellulose synthase (UDP-forming)
VRRLVRVAFVILTVFLLLQLVSLYLSWPKQLILACVSILCCLVANRLSDSRSVTLGLMLVSMTATFRYGWWRVNLVVDFFSDEANNRFGIDSVFLFILLSAEAYTVVIMVLGYMQTAWPLHRPPIQLPNDSTQWPHVDVLLPTYNEPLSLVRYTALAAKNMDYPPEKLHVYILDDGSREDFRMFAIEADVGYVTRVEHNHAKAGNINHALTTMSSPYVVIFDCDHVPTRSFLQITLGWMLADSLLAMLQTPHHFYSPDPFERNLLQFKTIPNEAELFYGIVQDGNDFWNATFFCGSCALLRRSALDEVGGIAVETVTEDAHTSLRMQKHGYNTAYINIPQAAGLATGTLAAHVGQRIRWARGMIQILRTDNPLLARGMKFTQRLCYFNAMIHFMYAVPRLVFLGAPLVYLLLGRTIIPGYWVAILAYALPHLVLSSLTNSRIQGRHRHSFWNEIYEAVLAPYILAPTLLALINPKLGKFNVTDKAGTLDETQFDRKIATPTKWMLLINMFAVLVVPYRLFVLNSDHPGAVLMNLVWVLFNIVILGVAAAVANEQQQRRATVRIVARIPVRMDFADGHQIHGMTIDMSVGGASVSLSGEERLSVGDILRVAFPEEAGEEEISAEVVGVGNGQVRLEFSMPTIAEQVTLTSALYSRADAWLVPRESREIDRPLVSLGRVIVLSGIGIWEVFKSFLPDKRESGKSSVAPTTAATLAIFVLCGLYGVFGSIAAQEIPVRSKAVAANNTSRTGVLSGTSGVVLTEGDGTTSEILTLKDMGVENGIEMRGPHSYYSVRFTLSNVLVPQQTVLKLSYSIDPSLDGRTTFLKVTVNGTIVATLHPELQGQSADGFVEVEVPILNAPLVRNNLIVFEFIGGGAMQREDQAGARVLARIASNSTLNVVGDRLLWKNDLSQLPLPIFDSDLQASTTVPFVFLSTPDPVVLESAGVVASWLGIHAKSKPVHFAAALGQIPRGNVVLISDNPASLPSSLGILTRTGSLIALRSNPSDAYGSVLVVAGDDDEQLLRAARTLSLTSKVTGTSAATGFVMTGDDAQIPELVMPPKHQHDDAPRWLRAERATPIASCITQAALRSDGSNAIPLYFHVPPDLYYGERQNLRLHINYQYNALPVAPGSALRLIMNGRLINEAVLTPGIGVNDRQRVIAVPVADIRPFGNTMLFNFDFATTNHSAPQEGSPASLNGTILCNSSLDLQGLALWARMPNLKLFANAGFPFTQLADLSETTVVLPAAPSADEISLYLHIMGHFGQQTGYPVLQVTVEGPDAVISKDRDYLILGTVGNQPAFSSLDNLLRVTLDSSGIHVKDEKGYLSFASSFKAFVARSWASLVGNPVSEILPSSLGGTPDVLLEEIESPSSPDRSIVLVALQQDTSAEVFADVFLDRSQSDDITSSVSLLRNGRFKSYPMNGPTYHVGDISNYAMMRIWLTQYFVILLLVVTGLSFVMGNWTRGWLSRRAHLRLKLVDDSEMREQ